MLCYALALSPALLLNIQQSSLWNHFVTDLLLKVKEKCVVVCMCVLLLPDRVSDLLFHNYSTCVGKLSVHLSLFEFS